MSTQTLEPTKPRASQRRPTKRLTAEDIGLLIRLKAEGVPQAVIAQRLDCDPAAVTRWLQKLTDTTETAKSILRGGAASMAENIVKKGLPRDHVAALKGLSVLEEERSSGLTIQIGCKDSDVSISLSPLVDAGEKRKGSESLMISLGSDKAGYANQGEGS